MTSPADIATPNCANAVTATATPCAVSAIACWRSRARCSPAGRHSILTTQTDGCMTQDHPHADLRLGRQLPPAPAGLPPRQKPLTIGGESPFQGEDRTSGIGAAAPLDR